MGFVHLHTHSEYSILDSTIKIHRLIHQAQELGMPAVALTDHANLYGAYEFYKTAKRAGIKPIIGCEVNVATKINHDNSADGKTYHLTVLSMNKIGYQNLSRLVTQSYLVGYSVPRVDHELLDAHNEGLIILSGCIDSELSQFILSNDMKSALEVATHYRELFRDRYYLEVQATGILEQECVNQKIKEIGEKLGIPLVATNDSHYLRKEDSKLHDVLLCIQTGAVIQDDSRFKFRGDQYFLKSEDEMLEDLKGFEDAVKLTGEVADRCNFEFEHNGNKIPEFLIDEGKSLDTHMAEIARKKLEEKAHDGIIPEDRLNEYKERLESELKIIIKMGFVAHFMIVADFIDYAKSQGIAVGPGRGAITGSLIAFVLGITEVDPVPHNLFFERFINPEHVGKPFFGFDFCAERRDEVISYLIKKYGVDKIAEVGTFEKMSSKEIVYRVGRVMGLASVDVDKIAKLIPSFRGHFYRLERAINCVPEIKELVDNSPNLQEMIDLAQPLENLVKHFSNAEPFSIETADIVIANEPLVDHIPLCLGSTNEIVTQYDIASVEEFGFFNLNFVSLKTLTIIDKALKLIIKNHGSEKGRLININRIPLDDPAVYKLLSSGETNGIFELESPGMQEFLTKLQPSVFNDLIAVLALYRPGPLDSGMVDDFIKRKHGKQKIQFPLPELKEILDDTYGLFVYQEQIMQTASVAAEYSLGEADLLRRALGKKKPEEIKAQRDRFLKGAKKKGITDKKAKDIFSTMEEYPEYSFNKSHGTAYALITYQTAYLKAHFPNEYNQALNSVSQFD